jgi:Zn-dependent protease with chaperone function
MKLSPKILKCNQKARFSVLFIIFWISFVLSSNCWTSLQEIIILSSLVPFFGYLFFTIGLGWLRTLFYLSKKGEIDNNLTSFVKKENHKVIKVVIKEINRPYAYASGLTNSIILTKKLVSTLSDNELKAVIHHELAHGGFYPLIVRVLLLIAIVPALFIFYSSTFFVVYTIVSTICPFVDMLLLSVVSSSIFCVFFFFSEKIRWKSEYNADMKAAEKFGSEPLISALRKLIPPALADCDSPSHPSLNRRLDSLKKCKKM